MENIKWKDYFNPSHTIKKKKLLYVSITISLLKKTVTPLHKQKNNWNIDFYDFEVENCGLKL